MYPNPQEYLTRHKKLIPPLTYLKWSGFFGRAKGTRLWDNEGKEYLDFNASVGTSVLGHAHPKILEVSSRQQMILDFVEGSTVSYCFEVEAGGKIYVISPEAFADALLSIMFPGEALGSTRLFGEVSGATAVNAAIKLCLKACPDKYHFVSFQRGFHGRHGYALEATSSKLVQKEDYPTALVFHRLTFPNSDVAFSRAMEELNDIPFRNTNAVIVEYIQGEGGFRSPVPEYMDKLLTVLKERGLFIIFDEIQSGLGRTGKWFAFEHGLVKPDIVVVGKALGGDVPVSAVGYRREIFDSRDDNILEPGWHSGTFLFYPSGVARALVILDVIKEEKLLENVETLGLYLLEQLDKLNPHDSGSYGLVNYLLRSGFGFMQGLEFRRFDGRPNLIWRDEVLRKLFSADPIGIFTLPAGNDDAFYGNPSIRLEPCLTTTREEIDYFLAALARAL